MTDHPDLATFELFTMGSLENDEAFVAHVAGCDACSATLAREARLELLLKDVPARRRTLRTIARLSLPFAAIAAAAAVLLAARGTTPSAHTATTATVSGSAVSADGYAADVRAVDEALRPSATACWEAGVAKDPAMEGRVDIEVTIASDGQVTRSVVTRNDDLSDEVAQCVATVYRNARFPARDRAYNHTVGFVFIKRRAKP